MNNLTINEIKNRDLDSCIFAIYFIPVSIYSNKGNDYIKEQLAYSVIACNIHGTRKYITTIFTDDFSKTSAWYDLFSTWKQKGLETMLYAVIPNDDKLKKALSLAFPEVECFLSCFTTIRKLISYFSCGYSSKFLEQIKNIFIAENIKEFEMKAEEFLEENSEYPFIKDLIADDLKSAKEYINVSSILRKHIFSFYFIRDYIKKLNIISHVKPNFSSLFEFEELILPTIQTFEYRMYTSKKEWNKIISIIYPSKKNLLIKYL